MKSYIRIIRVLNTALFVMLFAACSSTPKSAGPATSFQKIETGKKILVVYYSRTGNTERVAHDIAGSFGADIEKVRDKKDRSGCIGWIVSGFEGMSKKNTYIEATSYDPAKYDMVIIGSPVWSWNITPAIRSYIEQNKQNFREVAFFITAGSTSAEKVVPYMEQLCGKKAVAYVGFVSKELEKRDIYSKKLAIFLELFKKIDE